MSREAAVNSATGHFDSGAFKADLARRVAIPTDSRDTARVADLRRYIDTEMVPALEAMGFACRVLTHPAAPGPFLFAERIEDPSLLTVLGYGHGDVVPGLDAMSGYDAPTVWSSIGPRPWSLYFGVLPRGNARWLAGR